MEIVPTDAQAMSGRWDQSLAFSEHAPWPMAALEGTTHLLRYANPAFRRLLDRPLEQCIGNPFQVLLPAEDECLTSLDRVFNSGQSESHHQKSSSKPHPLLWSYAVWPVLAGGRPVGVMLQAAEGGRAHGKVVAMNEALLIGSLRQHELTDVAERLNAELRAEVAEHQRTEAALQVALADAQAARRAKDQFLAVLSHELRTPLTPVLMATGTLARRRDLPPSVLEALAMISRNVQLEASFIDELLDLTRIERGTLELVLAPMDLHEAIRRAVEVSEGDIYGKRQTLTVTLDAPESRLEGDFMRLQQAFWNLFKNAAKFTPEGGYITVRSRAGAEEPVADPSRRIIVIEISDTGIGMEEEVLARVFKPFEQANVEITRQFGGLGLGLAIAQATVTAHGGTLTASSPGSGAGATFSVTLPLRTSPGSA